MIDPYAILGIERTASREEIRKAYLSIAKATHPDRNPDPGARRRFIEAHQAYGLLRGGRKRIRREAPPRPTPTHSRATTGAAAGQEPTPPPDPVSRRLRLRREEAALRAGMAPDECVGVRPGLPNIFQPILFPAGLATIAFYLCSQADAAAQPHSNLIGAWLFGSLAAALLLIRARALLRAALGREAVWVGPSGIHIVTGRRVDTYSYGDIRTMQFGYDPVGRLWFQPHFLEMIVGCEARSLRLGSPYGERRLRQIVDLMLGFSCTD